MLAILLAMDATDALDELLTCRLDTGTRSVEPCSILIFGASGDLTARKLIPALYHLFIGGQLPQPFRIVGFARSAKDDNTWREELRVALHKFSRTKVDPKQWTAFASNLCYCQGDYGDTAAYQSLAKKLDGLGQDALRRNLLFYLATPPNQFALVAEQLAQAKLLTRDSGRFWQRLVVEKPFGHDLGSAQQLNAELTRFAHEKQIFRIDHYLGKETVQNIIVFRFSNAIFEQLWNRQIVDHVQLTVSEDKLVGSRGGYYEQAGALRDMVQNHLLQVLALIAMEPPATLDGEAVRDEKVKLLKSIRPFTDEQIGQHVIRGQYTTGKVNGELRKAYREEPNVSPASNVETYVALKLFIDNWRWSGVPFYVRTGKGLASSASEVRVQFRPPPTVLFAARCGPRLDANALTLRLQPQEGISLRVNGKVPGNNLELRPVRMHFSYNTEFGAYTPEAYERLLLEALQGDPTLFIRRDEVEVAWSFIDQIRARWGNTPLADSEFYPAGSWGPQAAEGLLAARGHTWRNPQPEAAHRDDSP
jgi:glucose-6-phosphate 1-dehydrogenase